MDTMRRTPQPPERQPAPSSHEPEHAHVAPTHESGAARLESVGKRSSKRSKGSMTKKKRFGIIVAVVAIIVVLAVGVWSVVGSTGASLIESGRYQAVFLSNGQVYFGKLSMRGDYYVLTDIYYLQSSTDATTGSSDPQDTATSDVKLIKLGTEVHGPEDEMVIAKEQVLFFENLQDAENSSVVKSINSYTESNN